jgi:sugar O-acyltransferase (sialic acid O-acetyltransferase NeuD family)
MQSDKKDLIIYGDSSFARMIAHYFNTDSPYRVTAYCVDEAYRKQEEIDGLPVIALERITEHFSPETCAVFAAIGYKSVRTHKVLFEKLKGYGFPMVSYISSRAHVDISSRVGVNCLVLPGVVLEPESVVEDNCYVNSGAIVCHHSRIKAHSVLAAGSVIGGYTTVGESSLIGFNATVAELLELGDETLLGAGSLLLENTQKHTMYVGTPAKAAREHSKTGIMIVPANLK